MPRENHAMACDNRAVAFEALPEAWQRAILPSHKFRGTGKVSAEFPSRHFFSAATAAMAF